MAIRVVKKKNHWNGCIWVNTKEDAFKPFLYSMWCSLFLPGRALNTFTMESITSLFWTSSSFFSSHNGTRWLHRVTITPQAKPSSQACPENNVIADMEHSKMNESIIPTCIVLKHTFVVTKNSYFESTGPEGWRRVPDSWTLWDRWRFL